MKLPAKAQLGIGSSVRRESSEKNTLSICFEKREFFPPHFAIENFAFKCPGVLLEVTHVLAVEFSAVMI